MSELTHLDESGAARMVDVGAKPVSHRIALSEGWIRMQPETLQMIIEGEHKKGDVFTVAKVAGIQAAKQCSNLIPMCHALMLSSIDIDLIPDIDNNCVHIVSTCRLKGQTGVEMEALTGVSVALLAIYDMCKAVDKEMQIDAVKLVSKTKEDI